MEKIDLAMQKAAVLTEALPYIQDFCGSTVLVKVGGSVMENEANLASLLADIAFMDAVGMRVALVHGGGKAQERADALPSALHGPSHRGMQPGGLAVRRRQQLRQRRLDHLSRLFSIHVRQSFRQS